MALLMPFGCCVFLLFHVWVSHDVHSSHAVLADDFNQK